MIVLTGSNGFPGTSIRVMLRLMVIYQKRCLVVKKKTVVIRRVREIR